MYIYMYIPVRALRIIHNYLIIYCTYIVLCENWVNVTNNAQVSTESCTLFVIYAIHYLLSPTYV